MSARLVLSLLVLLAARLAAQTAITTTTAVDCPAGTGLVVRTAAGDAVVARDSVARPPAPFAFAPSRDAIDTTIAFDVPARTWTRDWFSAALALGIGPEAGTTDARRAWRACAGASVWLGQSQLTLRGARGRVHLRADAGALRALATRDSTVRQRR